MSSMGPDTMLDSDPLATLRGLTREQVQHRIDEIEAERAQLITLRRSIAARERARRRRTSRQEVSRAE
jgi:hypothetical protein